MLGPGAKEKKTQPSLHRVQSRRKIVHNATLEPQCQGGERKSEVMGEKTTSELSMARERVQSAFQTDV